MATYPPTCSNPNTSQGMNMANSIANLRLKAKEYSLNQVPTVNWGERGERVLHGGAGGRSRDSLSHVCPTQKDSQTPAWPPQGWSRSDHPPWNFSLKSPLAPELRRYSDGRASYTVLIPEASDEKASDAGEIWEAVSVSCLSPVLSIAEMSLSVPSNDTKDIETETGRFSSFYYFFQFGVDWMKG